jgi:hypothetical protein
MRRLGLQPERAVSAPRCRRNPSRGAPAEAQVPRAKYAKPPGPFPAIKRIKRSKFHFRNEQRRKLSQLLPSNLANLKISPADAANLSLPQKVKTISDYVIQLTEGEINTYLTGRQLIAEGQTSPASNRAAVCRLRRALTPFLNGSVDDETANIIPADLDDRLAAREKQLAQLRAKPAARRMLEMLAQSIEVIVRRYALAYGETVSENDMLRFIDAALSFAGVRHPDVAKHRARLLALVFPKNPASISPS